MLLNQDNKLKDIPVIHRVLLFTPSIRKHLDFQNLESMIKQYVSDASPLKADLLRIIAKYIVRLVLCCDLIGNERASERDEGEFERRCGLHLASILIYQLLTINRYDDVCINDGIAL